ncbi:type I CRISPR-associated protein Cas7, partial [Alicyclobacillus tolerans]
AKPLNIKSPENPDKTRFFWTYGYMVIQPGMFPYGLYRMDGFISAPLAQKTNFSEEDLEILWTALLNMFDHDRSASRGKMATQKLIVFEHSSSLGNAPAHKLFNLVSVKRKSNVDIARSFDDYDVTVGSVPEGVTLIEKL